MMKTIVASSHSVMSDRTNLREMKRVIALPRSVTDVDVDGRGAARAIPSAMRCLGDLQAVAEEHLAEGARVDPGELLELPAR